MNAAVDVTSSASGDPIARHFSRAASNYTQHHAIQQLLGRQLIERLEAPRGALLDIGCGPAALYTELNKLTDDYWGMDVASGMLRQARTQTPEQTPLLQGNAETLPFASDRFGVCYANLSLQWCNSLRTAVAEMYRVLKPGGQGVFNVPVEGTFTELKNSWRSVDQHPHTQAFKSVGEVIECVRQAGVVDCTHERHEHVQYFADTRAMLQSIKGVGASYVDRSQQPGLMTPRRYSAFSKRYESYRTVDGLPLSWVVLSIKIKKPS